MASETAQVPSLVPKTSKSANLPREDTTARRKSAAKSRNGCVTCKARRVKCDETKPACNQCTRRRVTCGGYRKDIRFRPVEKAPGPATVSPRTTAPTEDRERTAHKTDDIIRLGEAQSGSNDPTSTSGDPPSALSFWPWLEEDVPDISLPDFDLSTLPWMDFSQLDLPSASDDNNTLDRITAEVEADSGQGMEDLEEVASLFHQEILPLLCIWDDQSRNPWRTLIWPMAQESKAVYHALAAMSFLQHSKYMPPRRERGLVHARKSTQQLAADLSSGEIQIEAALAATIALGFAESWDFQKASSGRTHIQGAKILLQQSFSQHKAFDPPHEASARLRFLANTWIYMDVLARLTSDCGPSLDPELLHFFTDIGPLVIREELDPLMGYAASLFPIIGRVADLITQIRMRSTRRNSPVIISKGIELRHVIEDWSPAIDLEQIENPTNNMVECIQTAEAYRWSTLLLLQEAVPELPSLASYKELGQKTLVYLATIPSNSATLNVHIYPLMVAATEAVEEEDREFVRDRWNIMRKRMVNGIIDRCADIMEEVWRRRDVHFSEWLARNSPDPSSFGFSSCGASGIAGLVDGSRKTSPGAGIGTEQARSPTRKSTAHSDFPISIAFKRGVDPITRSGNVDYTVKGGLHWITVMKERGWEDTATAAPNPATTGAIVFIGAPPGDPVPDAAPSSPPVAVGLTLSVPTLPPRSSRAATSPPPP
ncbi:hypothetical protein BU23DRAFT_586312 [Bimuria novae-zelandiae CBS 107.79]|uniref:Zn(2)-C6 fungal-type domain-containing protein n=1 Tax=Bimuria novae-zelandiae CBS 107.79 TaxID=1447943 RepID=A0A6A5VXY2_9PLEO|nr:hypothetical protein BU23DRAFT_586312 [Bimuria novae-zelandiae CBS 107.79]